MLVADLARDIARLLVPVACAGCGRDDERLCESCSAPWWDEPFRAEEGAGRLAVLGRTALPVWAISELDGPPHRAIAAWKDGRRRDLDRWFADAARRAAACVAPSLPPAASLIVVPIPSKPASVRRRGVDLTALLATAVGQGLGAPVADVLAAAGRRSRGRSSVGRWDAAQVRFRGASGGRTAVLIDDVMTTGATLARAADALETAAVPVVGAVVLAATPRRGADAARGLG